MKEFKVEVPEGYEIDKENSTFEKIVFKKKRVVNSWDDLVEVSGYIIGGMRSNIYNYTGNTNSDNRNVFLNEKYAKSALALAQISQLLPYYDHVEDCTKTYNVFIIDREEDEIRIEFFISSPFYRLLAFRTREEAERFLKYNEQLVKDYFMV